MITISKFFITEGKFWSGPGGAGGGGSGSAIDASILADYAGIYNGAAVTTNMVATLENALSDVGNPYTGETSYNPSYELSHMQDRYDTYDTKVSALDYSADFDTIVDKALSKYGLLNSTLPVEISGKFSTALSEALTNILAGTTTIASSVITNSSSINLAQVAEVTTSSHSLYDSTVAKAISAASTHITAGDVVAESYVLNNYTKIFNNILSKVLGTVQMAADQAANIANSSIITKLRDALSTRKEKTYYRGLANFAAQMADVNAVNSPAFVIGMALLESDREESLDASEKEFTVQLYNTFFTSCIQAFNDQVNNVHGMYNKWVEMYLQQVKSSYDSIQMVINALAEIRNRLDVTNLGQYSDLIKSSFLTQAEKQIQVDLSMVDFKDRYSLMMADLLQRMQAGNIETDYNSATLQVEIDRMKLVAISEQYVQDLQIDLGYAKWDLEAFQYAANLIACPQGAVVTTPAAATKGQSVLAGALAGASIGAKATPGSPWGALAGAALGGVGAALMR